jgi:hypothetical protein
VETQRGGAWAFGNVVHGQWAKTAQDQTLKRQCVCNVKAVQASGRGLCQRPCRPMASCRPKGSLLRICAWAVEKLERLYGLVLRV